MVRRTAAPTTKAIAFFRKHASHARGTSLSYRVNHARTLARAEAEASTRGWRVEWEGDPDGEDETVGAVLRDEHGHMVSSKWGLHVSDRNQRRVVEAALAVGALERR